MRCLAGRHSLEAGKCGDVSELSPVAQDRSRANEFGCLIGKAAEAGGDGVRDGLRSEFVQSRRVLGCRWNAFARGRVEQSTREERIAAGDILQLGGERFLRLDVEEPAGDLLDRPLGRVAQAGSGSPAGRR